MQRIIFLLVISWTLFVTLPVIADEHSEKGFFSFLGQDDDDDDDHGKKDGNRFYNSYKKISAVSNKLYLEECGSCHMAYQPELLPEESWVKVMQGLKDHFGDSAELEKADHQAILTFLTKNSAEKSSAKVSRKLLRHYKGTAPIRISQLPYFVHEHDEIGPKVLKRPKIRSWSNCSACHRTAERGSYSERYIKIPR